MGRLQLTLALIKPDVAAQPHLVTAVRNIILKNNFYMVRTQEVRLKRADAERFYVEHKERFFYNRLVSYMSCGPLWAHVLAHPDAIARWRHLQGPTKVFKAIHEHPDSIRGMFGLTDTRNSTHGSDSDESAKREMTFFFPEFDVDRWYEREEPLFRAGNVVMNPERMEHVSSSVENSHGENLKSDCR